HPTKTYDPRPKTYSSSTSVNRRLVRFTLLIDAGGLMATNSRKTDDDGIDYDAEGSTPPHEKEDPTNGGYDEAAHRGPGKYGVKEGQGGVFGTSGGGTYGGGLH